MRQLLHVLNKCKTIIFGLVFLVSMPLANAELDLKVQMQILDALSTAVANFEDEEKGITKYHFGELKKYKIDSYKEYFAGGEKGYRFRTNSNSVSQPPGCCEPDLYVHIFGEVHYQTQEEIIDAATQEVGYWFESSFIENFSSGGSDDIKEASQERDKLQAVYDEQKALITNSNAAILKSKAFEIFANDSTFDSNFDLLEDLKDIEKLLFGDNVPWETFQIPLPNQDQTSSPTNYDLNLEESDIDEVIDELEDDVNNDIPSNQNQEEMQEEVQDNQEAPQDFTPDQCGVSPNLQESLERFSINQDDPSDQEDSNETDESEEPEQTPEQDDQNPEVAVDFTLPSFSSSNPLFPEFECYTGSDVIYSTIGRPEQRFCFYIKEVRQNLRLLTPSNNCTNCIFDSMQEKLLDTNDRNLIPQKLTGNYFEPPICKKDLLKKINSTNFSFVAKSIFSLSSPQKGIQEISPSEISQRYRATKVEAPPIEFSNAGNYLEVVQEIEEYQRELVRRDIDRRLALGMEETSSTQNSVNAQLKERMELFNKNLKTMQDSIFSLNETAKLFLSKPKCQ